jgi:trehalose 6-phosphate synthase/phosphatase
MSLAQKMVIVSNRLPVSVSKVDGELHFSPSDGGLATGINSLDKSSDSVWVGWPGIDSDVLTAADEKKITKELKKYGCHPVFLSREEVDFYYSGYSNATLWPMFHYFPTKAHHDERFWDSYKCVNEKFAKEARRFKGKDAVFWVHDYQLMLVPQMLRQYENDAKIGFFLHTPFPSQELFRLLPNREELLQGLLGADLVGFHTYDYVRHFLSSVLRIVGYESSLGRISLEDRVIQTDAFPIGIDYNKFAKSPKKINVKRILKSFDLFKEKTKVILAVDRADYSKGIITRLEAFALFLEKHPENHGKVVLVLLAVPSREDVDAYQELRENIEQKVSRINGEYSTVDWAPINYRYQSLPFNELSALYALADVMLVTPLRDGMNLVAKEYVASHHKSSGVLILSEMAGVATELPEALQVNPNNAMQVVTALDDALHMEVTEQKKRMKKMQARISEYTIKRWAKDFLHELHQVFEEQSNRPKLLQGKTRKKLLQDVASSQKRLILLDYDGTLKSFEKSPHPDSAKPSKRVKQIIKKLSSDSKNKVVIVSGRPKNTLMSYFDEKGLGMIAEHGGWIFDAGKWAKSSLSSKRWIREVQPILEQYASRTPGSEVEVKDFSIVWHYRNVSPDMAYVRKEELKNDLQAVISSDRIGIFEGQKIIEVKPKRMHKGVQVAEMVSKESWDFILAIGDDYTDEDMFEVLPESAHSIHVGSKETYAKHQVDNVSAVLKLLEEIAHRKLHN